MNHLLSFLLAVEPESWFDITDFFTAAGGAILALLLSRFVTQYDERIKYQDIRKLITSDLKNQKRPLLLMRRDIISLFPIYDIVMRMESIAGVTSTFTPNYGFQTDTFKSQTRMDFFKSLKENDFHLLMHIYNAIKIFEPLNLLPFKESFLRKRDEILDKDIPEDHIAQAIYELSVNEKRQIEGFFHGIQDTLGKIDELTNTIESEYDDVIFSNLIPLHTLIPLWSTILSITAIIISLIAVVIAVIGMIG